MALQEYLGGGEKVRNLVHQFQAKQATTQGPGGATLKPYYKGDSDLADLGYGSAAASSSHSQNQAGPSKKTSRVPQSQVVDMRAEPPTKTQVRPYCRV